METTGCLFPDMSLGLPVALAKVYFLARSATSTKSFGAFSLIKMAKSRGIAFRNCSFNIISLMPSNVFSTPDKLIQRSKKCVNRLRNCVADSEDDGLEKLNLLRKSSQVS